MERNNVSTDLVIAELISMGFEFDQAIEALDAVGPSLENAVEFILNDSCNGNASKNKRISSPFSSTSQTYPLGRRVSSVLPSRRMKQSSIADHLSSSGKPKRRKHCSSSDSLFSGVKRCNSRHVDEQKVSNDCTSDKLESISESSQQNSHTDAHHIELKVPSEEISEFCSSTSQEIVVDWERKVRGILLKHFGFSSLKSFQKEALEAWLTHRDCLVLAATGSGKSLCFQIPALLTGKIVVVISPLISLMHDQCLKLAKHGISACFLGSGQPDKTVECKAMSGMYKIIYVCPETILRLMEPLKRLAENPGIALFAIDEVHCVSKWGHDFRPDYRRLSILRETFTSCNLKSLKFDIPLMALTATATIPVREDIVNSLLMSKETKIVLTSFFRPNLRFSVKHSRTSSPSSYDKDFHELVKTYVFSRAKKREGPTKILNDIEYNSHSSCRPSDDSSSDADEALESDFMEDNSEDECVDGDDIDASVANGNSFIPSEGGLLTVEYLEDEVDIHHSVDDLDVSCGEFPGDSPLGSLEFHGTSETDLQQSLQQGPTIIYVPTRKETIKIAEYLSKSGVRAAAYHAKLPKSHLRQVHQEFHQNALEIVVATIAFGMGIDKSNVRRIIHYGWPQMVVAARDAAQPAGQVYWKKVLPNTPMPRAIKNLLTGAGDNVRKDSVTIDAQHKGSINIPYVFKVHGAQGKGSMNIDDVYKVYGTQSGTKMHKHVGYPRYVLDMLFFVGNDLQTGTRMTLHFTDPSSCDTPFISRSEANSLPFTSSKLPEILDHFSIQPNSNQAESMRSTLTACEQPAMEGEKKHCATSLESMIDFSTTTLGSHDVITLSTSADRENSPKQQYEIISFRARKMSGCNSVFCHTLSYAYAVFYCHTTEEAKTYHVSLVGKDGTRVEAVAICHTETSNWDPTDLPFRVLGVKPGMVPICHFLPQGHVVWTPRIK